MMDLIWIGYALLCAGLFEAGIDAEESLMRRLKFAALGVAFMSFGLGYFMIYTLEEGHSAPALAVFVAGHIAFQIYGALLLIAYWRDRRGRKL